MATIQSRLDKLERTASGIRCGNAAIRTCAVDISILTVSDKQMTLSVFRQLKQDNPVLWSDENQEFVLKGIPWGIVNYHWSGCGRFQHIHLVWQDESTGTLARATLQNTAEHDDKDVLWFPWGEGFFPGMDQIRIAMDGSWISNLPPMNQADAQKIQSAKDGVTRRYLLQKWLEFYEQVELLPQLFIAV